MAAGTDQNGVTSNTASAVAATGEETPVADRKGKGKAVATDVPEDVAMDEDDDDDEEDDDEAAEDADEDDEGGDDTEEAISLENVVGRRTRGKVIDFAKAAEENPAYEDDDEDDDEDFEDEEDKMDED